MQEAIGSMMNINDKVKIKYIGEDNPLALRTGKIYDGRVLKKGWFGVVDETDEEYAYPPEVFQIMEVEDGHGKR